MDMVSRDCQRAQRAYTRVTARVKGESTDKYKSFALGFPALIHSCGLAQAIAYAQAKDLSEYKQDLAYVVMKEMEIGALAQKARMAELPEYRRLTLDVISAASWIKRYVEAFFEKPEEETDG
jgi:CRISPR-associated protein Cmr5